MEQNKPFKLEVGDYCYAYAKGIHKVIAIEFPTERASTALVTLKAVLDSSFMPHSRTHTCDVSYCRKVTSEQLLQNMDDAFVLQRNNVIRLMK